MSTPPTAGAAAKKADGVGPRGIPKAVFIDSIEEHVGGPEGDVERALKDLQELLAKYKFMEQSTLQKRTRMEEKVPELERTLEMVDLLKTKKDESETLDTHFELADTVYARAEVQPVEEVYLWLGANTMLAYPLDEARSLLNSKLEGARQKLDEAKEDQAFLRDQITTSEVNVARVYNYDVKRRKEKRAKEVKA